MDEEGEDKRGTSWYQVLVQGLYGMIPFDHQMEQSLRRLHYMLLYMQKTLVSMSQKRPYFEYSISIWERTMDYQLIN